MSGLRSSPLPAPRHLLVVDDEVDIRESLALVLGGCGYLVTAVASGEAAIAALREQPFDLVISDLRMPGLSGEETLSALKAIAPALPVLVATGYASEAVAAECARRGASGHLSKPFDLAALLDAVAALLP